MRVEQSRRIGLQARTMNEAQKLKRAETERKQYAELNETLRSFSLRSQSALGMSASDTSLNSTMNRTKDSQLSFCEKLATPIKREANPLDGPRPSSANNLRTHWVDEIKPPPITWAQLEQQVYGGGK